MLVWRQAFYCWCEARARPRPRTGSGTGEENFFEKNLSTSSNRYSPPTEANVSTLRRVQDKPSVRFRFANEKRQFRPGLPTVCLSVCLGYETLKRKRKKEGRNTECENVFLGLGRFMPRCHDARIVLYLQINRASQRKTTLVRDLRPPFFPTKLT